MQYEVYIDGSMNDRDCQMASSYFIRTSDTFVDSGVKTLGGKSANEAEANAMSMAVGALLDVVNVEDIVNIYVDNSRVCDCANYLLHKRVDDITKRLVNYLKRNYCLNQSSVDNCMSVIDLSRLCEVNVYKEVAHTGLPGGNMTADRIAKYALRFIKRDNIDVLCSNR